MAGLRARSCSAPMILTVPVFERMTSDWVAKPPGRRSTPLSIQPSVTPVAAKAISPLARSASLYLASEVGDPHAARAGTLVVVAEHQAPHHLAAGALQRRRRQHALGGAADTHVDVDAGFGARGGDHPGDVAVLDQPDTGAGLARLGDQRVVARAIENQRDQVGDLAALGPGEVRQVAAGLLVEIDDIVGQAAADGDLLHVGVGRVQEPAVLGERQHGERVSAAGGGDGGALERIEGDVDPGTLAGAHLLADEEHRRLVALALADHHGAVDVEAVERAAHGVDRRLVGGVLVTAAHPGDRGDRRGLGHAHRLE